MSADARVLVVAKAPGRRPGEDPAGRRDRDGRGRRGGRGVAARHDGRLRARLRPGRLPAVAVRRLRRRRTWRRADPGGRRLVRGATAGEHLRRAPRQLPPGRPAWGAGRPGGHGHAAAHPGAARRRRRRGRRARRGARPGRGRRLVGARAAAADALPARCTTSRCRRPRRTTTPVVPWSARASTWRRRPRCATSTRSRTPTRSLPRSATASSPASGGRSAREHGRAADPAPAGSVGPTRRRGRPDHAVAVRRPDARRRVRAGPAHRRARRAGRRRARHRRRPAVRSGGPGDRGGAALRRDVFDTLPGEGRWETALLADGNVGIGGDPVALLRRLREVLDPRGRVVAEVAAPGTPPHRRLGRRSSAVTSTRSSAGRSSGSRTSTRLAGAGRSRRRRAAPVRRALVRRARGAGVKVPAETDFRVPAAQRGGHRPGRHLARHLLHDLLRHRPDQPLRPERLPADPVPDQPVVGLPGHPGPARHHRYGGRAAAAGQALDRLPAALHPPAARRRAGCCSRSLERGSIAVLVAGAIFQLASGLANSAQWYPWSFSFRTTHYAIAWITIGALVVHIAVKLPIIRGALTSDVEDTTYDRPTATRARSALAARAAAHHLAGRRGRRARRPQAARSRCCARCRSSGSAPATARPASRSTSRPRPPRSRRRRRARPTASPWRTATARSR